MLDTGILDPTEVSYAVQALPSGKAANQATVYANLNPAVDRFKALEEKESRTELRDALKSYIRAYAFLAPVMSWTERDLVELYLYGKALAPLLPADPSSPIPQISYAVLLTHLRTEAQAIEEDLSLDQGSDEPGVALPGGGAGPQNEPPMEKLFILIRSLNDRFGMDLNDADKVWFEQQKQAVKDSADVRVVALNNDYEPFRVVQEKFAEDAIVDRRRANGVLFQAFFEKPGIRGALMEYLGGAYKEIREAEET